MIDVHKLREDFDRAFAEPITDREEPPIPMLAVRAGGDALAIPVHALRGVERVGRILPLPGTPPSLLGLAGVRGRLVPVHALSTLLGGLEAARELRWLVLAGDVAVPVGFAFEELEGFISAPRKSVHPLEEDERRARRVTAVVRAPEDEARGVVDIAALLAQVLPSPQQKES